MKSPEERARDLLCGFLSDHQRRTLAAHGFFYVAGRDEHVYALTDGWNVFAVDDYSGRPILRHQIMPVVPDEFGSSAHVPTSDSLLAQMLLIQADTRLFHTVACAESIFARSDGGSALMRGGSALMRGAYYPSFCESEPCR